MSADGPGGAAPTAGQADRRPLPLPPLLDRLLRVGAPSSYGAYGSDAQSRSTFTDAGRVQISRSGVATGLVSIPLRYMHSPVEMADLRDVEAAVRLLAAVGARLDGGVDLTR
jgi:putative aminopeptidase FrvX